MAEDPEEPITWDTILAHAHRIEEEVTSMPPPPFPDDSMSELMSSLNNASAALVHHIFNKVEGADPF